MRHKKRSRPSRLLLVGFGKRGQQWAEEVAREKDALVVGVVDPDPKARAFAEKARLAAWDALEPALATSGADGAIVASVPWKHADNAIACLRSGVPVLIEKPLALTLDAAAGIAAEALRTGLPSLVVQNFRFRPRELIVGSLLREEAVGHPTLVVISSSRQSIAASRSASEIEYGELWDFCIHHLDMMRVRFGLPEAVWGEAESFGPKNGSRGSYSVRFRWAGGLSLYYHHSVGAPSYRYNEWIEGPGGAIAVDRHNVSLVLEGRRPRRKASPRSKSAEQVVLSKFLQTLSGVPCPELSVDDNLLTVALAEAVVLSFKNGGPVSIAEIVARQGFVKTIPGPADG